MAHKPEKTIVLDGTGTQEDFLWWTKSDDEIGEHMVRAAQKLETAQYPRREQSRRYVQLFKGQLMSESMLDAATARDELEDIHPCWNVIQGAVNTEQSVVTRNKVRIAVDTNGADWELQEDAKDAELFIAGVFARNKVYEELDPKWFMDADVPGLGLLLVEDEDGNVVIRRVIPDAFVYNEVEAACNDGRIRQAFIVTWMAKWSALQKYGNGKDGKPDPVKVAAINGCTAYQVPIAGAPEVHIPLIPVWKGWFLPSKANMSEDECDGRRVIAIPGTGPGATLDVRKWKHTRFPLAMFKVEQSPAGLWGIGAAERLSGFQHRLNELNWLITEAARLGSVGKWFLETGAGVNPDELTDEHGGIVSYTKTKPEFQAIDGIPKDLLNERNITYQQALKERGLSEWTVGGVQPDNIESGEGLRQLRDQEQGRAVPAGQHWEAAHVDLAECVCLAASDAATANKDLKVTAKDDEMGGIREVAWSKIARILQDPDSRVLSFYPTSILPNTPTARFEKLREWKADGTIDAATFAALSEMPDINSEASLQLEGVKAVRHQISRILREGEKGYEPPDPSMPLGTPGMNGGPPQPGYGLRLVQATYNRGLRQGLPEDRQALLLAWRDAALELLRGRPLTAGPAAVPAKPASPGPAAPPPGPAAPATVPPGGAPVAPGDLGAVPPIAA